MTTRIPPKPRQVSPTPLPDAESDSEYVVDDADDDSTVAQAKPKAPAVRDPACTADRRHVTKCGCTGAMRGPIDATPRY